MQVPSRNRPQDIIVPRTGNLTLKVHRHTRLVRHRGHASSRTVETHTKRVQLMLTLKPQRPAKSCPSGVRRSMSGLAERHFRSFPLLFSIVFDFPALILLHNFLLLRSTASRQSPANDPVRSLDRTTDDQRCGLFASSGIQTQANRLTEVALILGREDHFHLGRLTSP